MRIQVNKISLDSYHKLRAVGIKVSFVMSAEKPLVYANYQYERATLGVSPAKQTNANTPQVCKVPHVRDT